MTPPGEQFSEYADYLQSAMAGRLAEGKPIVELFGLTGTTTALEPGRQDFPQWPMTAAAASVFIRKVIA